MSRCTPLSTRGWSRRTTKPLTRSQNIRPRPRASCLTGVNLEWLSLCNPSAMNERSRKRGFFTLSLTHELLCGVEPGFERRLNAGVSDVIPTDDNFIVLDGSA